MGLIFHNGSLLFVGGAVAMSSACCCGGGCCERLQAYASLQADVISDLGTSTIEITGNPTDGWTGASGVNITVYCLGDVGTNQVRFRIEVYEENSGGCSYSETAEVDGTCSPLDVTFTLSPPGYPCSFGSLSIRVYGAL